MRPLSFLTELLGNNDDDNSGADKVPAPEAKEPGDEPPAPAPPSPPAPEAQSRPKSPAAAVSADTLAEQRRWATVLGHANAESRLPLACSLLANPAILTADSIVATLATATKDGAPAGKPKTDAERRIAAATPRVPAAGPEASNEGDEGEEDGGETVVKLFDNSIKNMVADPKMSVHRMRG